MGILLLPAFIFMFLVFFYFGVNAGIIAVSKSSDRVTAGVFLAGITVALIFAEFIIPFSFVSSSAISAGGFTIKLVFFISSLALLGGKYFHRKFVTTGKPMNGLFSAALFIAAAFFPIIWLSLAERMSDWFHVKWIY
jgi:hypothetical protein